MKYSPLLAPFKALGNFVFWLLRQTIRLVFAGGLPLIGIGAAVAVVAWFALPLVGLTLNPMTMWENYKQGLRNEGTRSCAEAVTKASDRVTEVAKTAVIDHQAEDQARIAELEAKTKELEDAAATRTATRNAADLDDACKRCLVPRAWMRGETPQSKPPKPAKAAPPLPPLVKP